MFEWIETAGAGNAPAYLAEVTGKTIIVLLIAGLFIALFRRGSAADRHRIWFAALFGVVLFPMLTSFLPSWSVLQDPSWLDALRTADTQLQNPVDPERIPATTDAMPVVTGNPLSASSAVTFVLPNAPAESADPVVIVPIRPVPQSGGSDTGLSANPVLSSLDALWSRIQRMHWSTALFWIWLAGAVFVLAQLITGAFGVFILARRAIPIREPNWQNLVDEVGDRLFLTRDVHLLRSRDTSMPMTWGGLSPVVLLPVDSDTWSEERKRCVLTHEFAHIKRWDCATQGVAQLACAVYWFNPFVWMAAKRMRIEREKACDDYVIDSGTKASNYAGHLLEIASSFKSSLFTPLGAVAMAKPSQLEGRVLSILDPAPRRHCFGTPARTVVSLLVLGIIFPLAAMVPAGMDTSGKDEVTGRSSSENILSATLPSEAEFGERLPSKADPNLSFLEEIVAHETVLLDEDNIRKEWTEKAVAALKPEYQEAPADTIKTKKKRTRLIQAFLGVLEDEEAEMRKNAAHMLGEMGGDESVEPLGRVLTGDPEDDVREQAAWALGEIGSDSAVGVLTGALGDSNPDVRRQVIWALAEIENNDAVDALANQLDVETDDEAREMLVWALGELEDERAVSGLAAAYRSESSPDIKRNIVGALARIESPDAIETLRMASQDTDKDVRRMAIWALGDLEDEGTIDVLIRAAGDSDSEIRRAAIRALGEFDDNRVETVMIDALSDENEEVREYAAHMCSEFENDRVVEALGKTLLTDSSMEVRRSAAWSLGSIETDAALDILESALDHEDAEVRKAAMGAIIRMGVSSYNSGIRSQDHYEDISAEVAVAAELAVAAASVAADVSEVTRSTVAGIANEIVIPNIGEVVSVAVEESLRDVDWEAIEILIERSLDEVDWEAIEYTIQESIEEATSEIGEMVIDRLIEIAETRPNSRSGREAIRALRNSSHPRAKAYLKK